MRGFFLGDGTSSPLSLASSTILAATRMVRVRSACSRALASEICRRTGRSPWREDDTRLLKDLSVIFMLTWVEPTAGMGALMDTSSRIYALLTYDATCEQTMNSYLCMNAPCLLHRPVYKHPYGLSRPDRHTERFEKFRTVTPRKM